VPNSRVFSQPLEVVPFPFVPNSRVFSQPLEVVPFPFPALLYNHMEKCCNDASDSGCDSKVDSNSGVCVFAGAGVY
jgi:hypothetical protein